MKAVLFCLLFALILLSGCKKDKSEPKASENHPGGSRSKVLASVNGVELRSEELDLLMAGARHEGAEAAPAETKQVLDTLIRQELFYQKGLALGLDKQPDYLTKLQRIEAQYRAAKRKEMINVFYALEIKEKIAVSEAEAKAYFEANAQAIRTEQHVLQIMQRGSDAALRTAFEQLEKGSAFETLAAQLSPQVPAQERPIWDLGFLHWNQLPPSWRAPLQQLKPGQHSGVIAGENKRFWLLKLVDRREDPTVDFAKVKELIVEILKAEKLSKAHEDINAKLRAEAKIVYY